MSTKNKTKKDKGLLSEILKDERDKEIEELTQEVSFLRAEDERKRRELSDLWIRFREERSAHEASALALQQSRQQDNQKYVEAVACRDVEIHKLRSRLEGYQTWVGRILHCDVPIQPPEVAISKVSLMLEILRASLKGETLEQAMQDLGYLETVFGFETTRGKSYVQIIKSSKLYNHDEGTRLCLEPQSTVIHAIKELRQHLGIGLKDAKDITDALLTGETREIEFTNHEGAETVASALRQSGYFSVNVVRR